MSTHLAVKLLSKVHVRRLLCLIYALRMQTQTSKTTTIQYLDSHLKVWARHNRCAMRARMQGGFCIEVRMARHAISSWRSVESGWTADTRTQQYGSSTWILYIVDYHKSLQKYLLRNSRYICDCINQTRAKREHTAVTWGSGGLVH